MKYNLNLGKRGHKMFNEERKLKFISSYTKDDVREKYFVNFFERLDKKVESYFNKDFCELSHEDSINGISMLNSRNSSTIYFNIVTLRDYNKWCFLNGYTDSQTALEGVSSEDINRDIEEMMIKSPEHLREILDSIPEINKVDVTMDTITKLYLSLIYNGLTEIEALELKSSDTDIKNNIIYLDGLPIKMYDVTKKYLKLVSDASELAVQRRNTIMYQPFEKNGRVIKLQEHKNRKSLLKNRIVALNKKYKKYSHIELTMSTKRIYDSGIFYRIYLLEQSNQEVDGAVIAQQFKINKNKLLNSSYLKRVADIKKDYDEWKSIL